MKFVFSIIISVFIALNIIQVHSQNVNCSEGRSFWFAIPYIETSTDEVVNGSETNSSYELFLTSRFNTIARIYFNDCLYKTVQISDNRTSVVSLNDGTEPNRIEEPQKLGFKIESDYPIEATLYMSWNYTGESLKIYPEKALGTNYYTLNMYQDYLKFHDLSLRYTQAEILILATQDSTDVTYSPKAKTVKGVNPTESRTVRLNKGETYLILSEIDTNKTHDWSTDLTGTNIVSNKPISVISGHPKVSFPSHSATFFGVKSDYIRNSLIEQMPPVKV